MLFGGGLMAGHFSTFVLFEVPTHFLSGFSIFCLPSQWDNSGNVTNMPAGGCL